MAKLSILCVDDEVLVLNSLRQQLKQAFGDAYFYETAENADEALEALEDLQNDGNDVVVVISDWLMPGMKGDEFLIGVHRDFPDMVKILLTGQADAEAIDRVRTQANLYRYIAKPWNREDLIDCIKAGLDQLQS